MDDSVKRGGYPTSELFTMILCDFNFVVSYFRHIFTISSLYIHDIFTVCSLCVYYMSLYVHYVFAIYTADYTVRKNVTPFLKLPYSEQ